jgi:hypothetical protein
VTSPGSDTGRQYVFRGRRRFVASLLVAAAFVCIYAAWREMQRYSHTDRLLLAPMIGGLDLCVIEAVDPSAERDADMKQDCRRPGGSAAARVEATLDEIGPPFSRHGAYELGYTLNVPLLRLFRKQGDDWRVDDELVSRFVRTVRDADRSVVLYLFATHFSVGAPIEAALALDPASLAASPRGPMTIDQYHGLDVYPWSVATTDNEITRRRSEAIEAIVRQLCELPWWHRRKIRAVTMLGEVHHLFPNFETGMGFSPPYVVSDYSDASQAGFRVFLADRFATIEALNAHLGSSFADFNQIEPPGKDIRRESLRHFWEHIDSFAHGVLPINGWAHTARQTAPTSIRIYLNGKPVGNVTASLGRQDVAAVHSEFGTADVGWRFDLPFSSLAYGLHRIDVFAETPDGLQQIGTRRFAYVDRTQSPVRPIPPDALPTSVQPGSGIAASIDTPADLASVFYNPLVPLWHEFRGKQVVEYLAYTARRLQGTCLAGTATYVHQIAPFANPSWDSTKYAVDASLKPIEGLRLGISLYGESSYGRSFFDWYERESGQQQYGVTEFHPLRAMDPDELRRTLNAHHAHGARFVSFFVDGIPRRAVPSKQSIFVYTVFSPEVSAFGSDRLFRSVRAIMTK